MDRDGFHSRVQNLRRALTIRTFSAGLAATLTAGTGPLAILLLTADQGGLNSALVDSWLAAVYGASGLVGLAWALWFREPVPWGWSITGAAFLITVIDRISYGELIGAYLISGTIIFFLGIFRLFHRVMALMPRSIVLAVLAALFLEFGVGLFSALDTSVWYLVLAVVAGFLGARSLGIPPLLGAVAGGFVVALLSGNFPLYEVEFNVAELALTKPVFTLDSTLSVALPLALLALSSHNATSLALITEAGYATHTNLSIGVAGGVSMLIAPLGGHGINLGTVMIGVTSAPSVHEEPRFRYGAAVVASLLMLLLALLAPMARGVLQIIPSELTAAIAGVAMLPVISNSFNGAFGNRMYAMPSAIAFLVTLSRVSVGPIEAPVLGLLVGSVMAKNLGPPD